MTKFKKGDKVRFIGDSEDFNDYVTYGKVYEISNVSRTGIAEFRDDEDDVESCSVIHASKERLFELVEESPRTESDLIANLALRVSELEKARNPHPELFGEPMGAEVGADNVNHPSHYTQGGVEVIDIIAQITRGYTDGFHAYCVGNALKYLARAPYKHAAINEDVRKAAKYIEFITEDKGAVK